MNNSHTEELPFLTDKEVQTQCYSYYNESSINAPSGKISLVLLPDSKLAGSMTMDILWGLPKQGTLTIQSGTWSVDPYTYRFTAEGYLVEFGGKKIHVGPLNLTLILDADGKKGVLEGIAPDTVAVATSCHK